MLYDISEKIEVILKLFVASFSSFFVDEIPLSGEDNDILCCGIIYRLTESRYAACCAATHVIDVLYIDYTNDALPVESVQLIKVNAGNSSAYKLTSLILTSISISAAVLSEPSIPGVSMSFRLWPFTLIGLEKVTWEVQPKDSWPTRRLEPVMAFTNFENHCE
jgi:hypothetical protein